MVGTQMELNCMVNIVLNGLHLFERYMLMFN